MSDIQKKKNNYQGISYVNDLLLTLFDCLRLFGHLPVQVNDSVTRVYGHIYAGAQLAMGVTF